MFPQMNQRLGETFEKFHNRLDTIEQCLEERVTVESYSVDQHILEKVRAYIDSCDRLLTLS